MYTYESINELTGFADRPRFSTIIEMKEYFSTDMFPDIPQLELWKMQNT